MAFGLESPAVVFVLAMAGHRFALLAPQAQSWLELLLTTPVVLWGAWHGTWLAGERFLGARKRDGSIYPAALALPITLVLVVVGWVMFRAPDVTTASAVG